MEVEGAERRPPVNPRRLVAILALALLMGAGTSARAESSRAYEAVHAEARARIERGEARQALELLEPALRKHPRAEPLHRLAGIAAFRLLLLERALSEFEAAIRLAPRLAFNYLKLASLELCERRNLAAAGRVLGRLWHELPGDVASREEAADLYAGCGAFDQAIELRLVLVRLDPSRAWLHYFKTGQLYHSAGRWTDARPLLERAVAEGPAGRPELFAQLGATLRRLGDFENSARHFRRALAAHPDAKLREKLERELAGMGDAQRRQD